LKSILSSALFFSLIAVSAGMIFGLSYNQNAFASSPPVVSVTSPANGATVSSSTVSITGTASSSSNTITSVQVSIDGASYVAATGTTSWSYTANGLAAGIHSITVKATDNQGLIGYSTNVVTGTTIPTGNGQELVFDPANGNIYVANIAQGTISEISSTTNQVINTISGLPGPTGITYDSVNGYLYTTNYNSNNVSVVDTATNHVVTTISTGIGINPFGVAYVPNGDIYVANTGSSTVSVIDPTTNNVVNTIPVGAHPQDFTYDSANHLLYMTNQGSHSVSVIDPSTNTVVNTIGVGNSPRGLVYDPANGKIYVANFADNTVSIIDTSNNNVSAIPTGSSGGPNGVAFDPANEFVYVPDFSGTRLNVMDSTTDTFINPVTLPSAPYYYYAIFDPINSDIYITSGTNVAIVQTQTQFTVTVQDTTTSIVSSQNPSTVGQSVTFTATVSPTPTTGDTVTFYDGATNIGTGTTNSTGQATLATSTLSVGSHSVTATFAGDSSFVTSTSSALSQTVTQITTTTTLTSSASILNPGQSVTFTATVSPTPTTGDTVTFLNGTSPLGTGTTNSTGQATFTTDTLSIGTNSITASYSGDTNNAASTSTPITITVLSLLGEKQSVIPSLQSLTAVDHDDKQDLKQAIEAVQDSVDPSLWQSDGIHLVVKKGEQVFDDEQQAVQQLQGIIDDKRESSSFNATVQNDISELVGVDQGLAKTAIADALDLPPSGDSAKDIAQAQKIMTDASTDADQGHFAEAIQDYSQAWSIAENANPYDHHFRGHCDYHDDYGNHDNNHK
jgi:YVTN family beta-propeller protein